MAGTVLLLNSNVFTLRVCFYREPPLPGEGSERWSEIYSNTLSVVLALFNKPIRDRSPPTAREREEGGA